MSFQTEQEEFWAGDFGNQYVDRNDDDSIVASNTALFTQALKQTSGLNSIMEFGANVGLNLKAIRQLLPKAALSAIEINQRAVEKLNQLELDRVFQGSILDYQTKHKFDLVLIKGVLIHINPEQLEIVYTKLFESSRRYILLAEYYNPTPVAVNYRQHQDKLFKRDFAGEMLDRYQQLSLVDYGFCYHRDNLFPSDDVTWFLLEKTGD